jgi:hypothetical protein
MGPGEKKSDGGKWADDVDRLFEDEEDQSEEEEE